MISYAAKAGDADTIFEAALDAGADDVESSEDGHDIWTSVDSLHEVAKAIEAKLGEAEGVKLAWRPTLKSEIADEATAQTLFKLIDTLDDDEIGRASCRERVCQSVYIPGAAVSVKKQNQIPRRQQ